MDYLTIVGACSLYRDLGLVLAMVARFSGGNPYAVVDARHYLGAEERADEELELSLLNPGLPKRSTVKSREEAWLTYERIVADGGEPVLGLLPVSPAWADTLDTHPQDLFDGCTAVSVGTALLDEFARQCGGQARACVVRKYAETLHLEAFADDVLAELRANHDASGRPAVIDTGAIRDATLEVPLQTEQPSAQWGVAQLSVPELSPAPPSDKPRPGPKKAR